MGKPGINRDTVHGDDDDENDAAAAAAGSDAREMVALCEKE